MTPDDFGDLRGVHEHPLDLGRLVGPAQPSFEAHVRTPARGWIRHRFRQHGGQVAGAEAHQRIVRVERRDDHFSDFSGGNRIAGAGPEDFDDDPFVDHQPRARDRFIGDAAEVGRSVYLVTADATRGERVAQTGRERFAGNERLGQRRYVGTDLIGLVQDDFQKRRSPDIAGGFQVGDRLYLHFGLSGAGWKDGAAHC